MSNPVLDLLVKHNIKYTESAKDYVIQCLNPDHLDSNPSYRVDKITGMSHCFSCGYKVNLFTHFGISNNFISIKVAKLKDKLKELSTSFSNIEFPEEMIPMNKVFRGISLATLKKFGAFYTTSNDILVDRLFLPITDLTGKVIVYVGRHMLSQGNPRYLIYPSGVTMPVFPEVYSKTYKSAVLVEGMFDMLNLYDKGLHNVSCTFGTNTMHKNTAQKLLPFKVQGIEKIYILYDGDTAGVEAAKKLKPLIEESGFLVEILELEDGMDPGDLDQDDVNEIIEHINGSK